MFVEDLTPEQRARLLKEKTGEAYPAGLVNLGNTCYMNSVVQNVKKIKELREAVLKHQPSEQDQDVHRLFMQESKRLF